MNRRTLTRVLLSLLLLLSQQMAISHTISHWAGALDGPTRLQQASGQHDELSVSAAFAQDQACEKCLAFAQFATALGSPSRSFAPDAATSCAPGSTASQPGCTRTVLVFQSRAPPSFA